MVVHQKVCVFFFFGGEGYKNLGTMTASGDGHGGLVDISNDKVCRYI